MIAGEALAFSGENFAPDAQLQLWLHSEPAMLTDLTASAEGAVAGAATIPPDTADGTHRLVVTNGAGEILAESADFTVTAVPETGTGGDTTGGGDTVGDGDTTAGGNGTTPAGGSLPSTGAEAGPMGLAALALLLAGLGLTGFVAMRRRREARG